MRTQVNRKLCQTRHLGAKLLASVRVQLIAIRLPFFFPLILRHQPEKHRKCCKLRLRLSQGWGLDSGLRLLHVGKDVVTVMIGGVCLFSWLKWYCGLPGVILLGHHVVCGIYIKNQRVAGRNLCSLWLLFFACNWPCTRVGFFPSKYLNFKSLIRCLSVPVHV